MTVLLDGEYVDVRDLIDTQEPVPMLVEYRDGEIIARTLADE